MARIPHLLPACLGALLVVLTACASPAQTARPDASRAAPHPPASSAADPDRLSIVDCLVRGATRKLGAKTIFVAPPRVMSTSQLECEIRGGEYVAYDPASYDERLRFWEALADQGDAKAQYYAGEIHEQGLGLAPDYMRAAGWYERAAEQGHPQAQRALARIYEQGLGRARDPERALGLLLDSYGIADLQGPVVLNPASTEQYAAIAGQLSDSKREADALRRDVRRLEDELVALEAKRSDARRATAGAERATRTAERDALAGRNRELERQIETLENELATREQALDAAEGRVELDIAGPTIHVVDPQLSPIATRGGESVASSTPLRRIVGQVVAPAGLERLTMNGETLTLSEGLVFETTVPVAENGTRIAFVAIDAQGKRAERSFLVTRGLPPVEAKPPVSSPTVNFGRYHALVIGNQNYEKLPDLETPHADVREISRLLADQYDFEVTTLLDANRYELMTALADLRKRLSSEDNLVVYYAGHGHLDEETRGGYWLPVDAELDSPAQWLPTDEITRQIGAMNAKHVLVVADSCYSGVLTRSLSLSIEGGRTGREREHYMETMAKRRVRMALTAGGLIPIPDGGGGNHSIFAEALISVLSANNEIMGGSQLHEAVAARVSYKAKSFIPYDQIPEYRELKHGDAEPGEFFFVPRILTAAR